MANLYRIVFCLLLSFLSGQASAVIPSIPGVGSWYKVTNTSFPYVETRQAACTMWASSGGYTGTLVYGGTSCQLNTGWSQGIVLGPAPTSCPADSTLTNPSSCTCNVGFVDNASHTACIPDCPLPKMMVGVQTDTGINTSCSVPTCKSSTSAGVTLIKNKVMGVMPPTSYDCVNNCIAKTAYTFGLKYTDSSGVVHDEAVGEPIFTGGACATNTADGSTAAKPAPVDSLTNPNSAKTSPCPVGEVLQDVNGVTVCVPVTGGAETSSTKTTKSTNAAGDTVIKTTITTCIGVECTSVTSTTTTPNGGSPTTTEDTESTDKDSFCTANPEASMCIKGSYSGSCTAAPECTGDAIQCAIADASYASNCVLNPKSSAESDSYDAAKVKVGKLTADDIPGSKDEAISSSSFNSTELLGGGAGVGDLTVTIMGNQMVVEMSRVNIWLERLGYILQALAFMLAVRIVGRGY